MSVSSITPTTGTSTSPKTGRFYINPRIFRENMTGWIFIAPAVAIIFLFGIFPIGYAVYMSMHNWRTRNMGYVEFANYTNIIGDWGGAFVLACGFILLIFAYIFWTEAFTADREKWFFLRAFIAFLILGVGLFYIVYAWEMMLNAPAESARLLKYREGFFDGLIRTFYYAFGSIPIQLSLALLLAYVLFQNIKGKSFFRMVFFMPYITPTVATAVVFGKIFAPGESSLINQFTQSLGGEAYRWLQERRPFLEVVFGWQIEGFFAGPSMAMVAIVIVGIWMYTGYNAVIFLAGLGNIPKDLYEAARVDGASEWVIFRRITLPLISPVTYYLAILGFIGTFQAFNTIYVMRDTRVLDQVNTAALVIFDTFKVDGNYGYATAQSILLFVIILALTQVQRSIFEKRVFYG
ncbi:MAG: sugar ABC transporter permease [bacterium]|nr:sugar ABC transporter permease [bacterium]